MPKYQAEDFSIATAADGDNSARAVKSVAIKGNNIKKARSGFTFFQTHFFLHKQKQVIITVVVITIIIIITMPRNNNNKKKLWMWMGKKKKNHKNK